MCAEIKSPSYGPVNISTHTNVELELELKLDETNFF
jgi:hypothetical protein